MKTTKRIAELNLLAAVFAVPFIQHPAIYQNLITISLALLCVSCFMGLTLISFSSVKINYINLFWFVLFVLVGLNAFMSPLPQLSLKIKELARIGCFFCISISALNAGNFLLEKVSRYSFVPLVISGIAGYIQLVDFISGHQIFFNDAFNGRIYSLFGNPDYFAAFLIVVIPIAFYSGKTGRLASMLVIPLLFMTKSFSALYIVAIMFLAVIIKEKTLGNRKVNAIIAVFVLVSMGVFFIVWDKKGSAEIRTTLLKAAYHAGISGLSGTGPGSYVIVSPKYMDKGKSHDEAYAHNDYAQIFAENGVILSIIFILGVIFGLKASYDLGFSYFLSSAGIAVFALFNFPFYMAFVFPLFFVLTAGQKINTKNISGKILLVPAVFMIFSAGVILKEGHVRYKMQAAVNSLNNPSVIRYIENNIEYIKSDYLISFYAGVFYALSGNDTKALFFYDNSLHLHPYFHGALFNAGNTLLRAGKPSEALYYYERAAELNDNSYGLINNYAVALAKAGRTEEAAIMMNKAQRLMKTVP